MIRAQMKLKRSTQLAAAGLLTMASLGAISCDQPGPTPSSSSNPSQSSATAPAATAPAATAPAAPAATAPSTQSAAVASSTGSTQGGPATSSADALASPATQVAFSAAPAGPAATSPDAPAAAVSGAPPSFPPATIDQPQTPVGSWPMWGLTSHRNNLSPEKNPPTDWDLASGKNILWSADLGSLSYGNPVVVNNVVTIGTNNEGHRDPNNTADGGVEMAFDATTGKFLWQKYYSKLPTGRVNDWPGEGLCSTGYSEPGKYWYCTNQCHVVCLDLSPGAHPQPDGSPPVLWDVDMIGTLGVFPHNMTASSPVSWGDYIYVETGNGVDDTHKHVVAPQAPGIVCFDKNTGKVVWTDNSPGPNVLHGQWSSAAVAQVNGVPLVIAPMGNAWVYAYDARNGHIVWKFDTNPKDSVYPQTRNEIIATPCIVGQNMYLANGQDPEHGEGYGHMWCVDITGHGDVSAELDVNANAPQPQPGQELVAPANQTIVHKGAPNPNSHAVWHFDVDHSHGKVGRGQHMNRSISSALITPEGLCIVPDFSGYLHCFDARTGQVLWVYDMMSAMWGSPTYADGKIYVCDEDGDVRIFPASRTAPTKADILEHNMGGASYCSPVIVNGVLYIMTRDHLFAIKNGAQSAPPKEQ